MTPLQKGMIEAQTAGMPRFIGPPCKVCYGINRYSCNGRCVRCSNEISRDWHRINRRERMKTLSVDAGKAIDIALQAEP